MNDYRRSICGVVIVVGAILLPVASAGAGATISLLPSTAQFDPGESFVVQFIATMTEAPINDVVFVRGLQFDFTQTDKQIGLPESMNLGGRGSLYIIEDELPRPHIVWPFPAPGAGIYLELNTPVLFGSVDIIAQDEAATTRTLDVANATATNPDLGAFITFGFGADPYDPITTWRFDTGDLAGGTLDITTVPEPATVVMLLLILAVGPRTRRP